MPEALVGFDPHSDDVWNEFPLSQFVGVIAGFTKNAFDQLWCLQRLHLPLDLVRGRNSARENQVLIDDNGVDRHDAVRLHLADLNHFDDVRIDTELLDDTAHQALRPDGALTSH